MRPVSTSSDADAPTREPTRREDCVDRESEASIPASDPPPHGGRIGGPRRSEGRDMRKTTMNRASVRLGACVTALALAGALGCQRETPRSDAAISTEVETQLALQEDLTGAQIEATALNGEVTLTGTVPNEKARDHAEDVADDVSGVSGVQNRLRVASETNPVGAPAGGR